MMKPKKPCMRIFPSALCKSVVARQTYRNTVPVVPRLPPRTRTRNYALAFTSAGTTRRKGLLTTGTASWVSSENKSSSFVSSIVGGFRSSSSDKMHALASFFVRFAFLLPEIAWSCLLATLVLNGCGDHRTSFLPSSLSLHNATVIRGGGWTISRVTSADVGQSESAEIGEIRRNAGWTVAEPFSGC